MKWNAEALDRFLEEKTAGRKLPGVAVCIRGPEGVLFSRGYGHRDGAGLLPVDGDTIFGVASMSKSMTALALAMLEEEGKLSLEDPVVRYFPAFRVPGNARDEVTLRHLATHTSGIPPMEPLEWSIAKNTPGRGSSWARTLQASAPNAMSTIQEVIDYIAQGRYPTLGAPGESHELLQRGVCHPLLCGGPGGRHPAGAVFAGAGLPPPGHGALGDGRGGRESQSSGKRQHFRPL